MDVESQEASTYTTRDMCLCDHGPRFRDDAWEGGGDAGTHPEGFFNDSRLFNALARL